MKRGRPLQGRVDYVQGRSGARDVVLCVSVPHGKHRRDFDVPVDPRMILALADAIRCCPQHVGESVPVAARPDGSMQYAWEPYVNLAHAIWHYENPDAVRPCLPKERDVIDVLAVDDEKHPQGRPLTPDDVKGLLVDGAAERATAEKTMKRSPRR